MEVRKYIKSLTAFLVFATFFLSISFAQLAEEDIISPAATGTEEETTAKEEAGVYREGLLDAIMKRGKGTVGEIPQIPEPESFEEELRKSKEEERTKDIEKDRKRLDSGARGAILY